MSWFREEKRSWLESLCINVLKCGPIPKHLAFIMDGNRRFASKVAQKTLYGHVEGFKKLSQTLQWCNDLGINEVTLYAFSIENFKRSKEEVKDLMDLAREKLNNLKKEKKAIMERGICIRVLGNISLLPIDIQQLIAEVTHFSRDNKQAFLNVCFAYTSREEITNAVKEISLGVEEGLIEPSDISESFVEQCLYTSKCNPPDIIVRTSGEVRLSDFLLWQSAYSLLIFVNILWPEFTIWHLFFVVIKYQRHQHAMQMYKEKHLHDREKYLMDKAYESVIRDLLKTEANSPQKEKIDENVRLWIQLRDERVRNFLDHLEKKRNKYLVSLLPN